MEPGDCPQTDEEITNLLVRALAHLAFVCFLHSRQQILSAQKTNVRIYSLLGDSPLASQPF